MDIFCYLGALREHGNLMLLSLNSMVAITDTMEQKLIVASWWFKDKTESAICLSAV